MKHTFNKSCYWFFIITGIIHMYSSYQRIYHDAGWGIFDGIHAQVLSLPMPEKILLTIILSSVYIIIVYRSFLYSKSIHKAK